MVTNTAARNRIAVLAVFPGHAEQAANACLAAYIKADPEGNVRGMTARVERAHARIPSPYQLGWVE